MFTIGLFEHSIRFLETKKDNKISFAGIKPDNFELDNLFKQNKLSETEISKAADSINRVLNDSGTKENTARLLIDTGKCFANVIPLDFSESKENINSNILWELSNYYPDCYKEFRISYHKLNSSVYTDCVKETLIIGIRKNVIEVLKKLSGLLNIKVTSIDIEHFASEKYFRAVRKNLFKDENILVIGCKKNRFDFSIINGESTFAYDYFEFKDSNFRERLIKTYTLLLEKSNSQPVNNIYLYGDENAPSAYKIINELSQKSRVFLSNPFYEIGITDNLSTDIVSEGYKFIPLCGLSSE
jgi:Tfp pilus assembly PilM family ATPase